MNLNFTPVLTALLFSATFRKKIERLARDILVDPIRVVQGDIGEVRPVALLTPSDCNFYHLFKVLHCQNSQPAGSRTFSGV